MKKRFDLTGLRFGRLLVLGLSSKKCKENSRHWSCLCDCGNEKVVLGKSLKNKSTRSCGCLRKETTSKNFSKHGLRNHKLYDVWAI